MEWSALIREPVFWLLTLSGGLCGAACVVLRAHLVPFALGLGMNLENAALLASIFGGAGLAGGLLSGMIADRIGGARTFVVISALQFAAWLSLLAVNGYLSLAACVAVIGLCANAMMPVVATLIANVFGRECFARAMGLFSVLTMPFGVVMPLVAGRLYDLSGSYRLVFLICAGIFAVAGTAFCFVSRIEVDRSAEAVPAT
jgi:MFS family permease